MKARSIAAIGLRHGVRRDRVHGRTGRIAGAVAVADAEPESARVGSPSPRPTATPTPRPTPTASRHADRDALTKPVVRRADTARGSPGTPHVDPELEAYLPTLMSEDAA